MQIKKSFLLLLLAIDIAAGCKENYEPPAIQEDISALVVDGFLNNSPDTTFIRLSRTKKLSEGVDSAEERNAQLFVEDVNGNLVYQFQELNNDGVYIVPGMNLDLGSKYKLRINTANGKQYLSDAISILKTPPIDSISFEKSNGELNIQANTHDPLNQTHYYRWQYVETWQYHATYFSSFKFANGFLSERQPGEFIYECWKTQPSTQLLLASSTKLAEDIIYHNTLRQVDQDGIELSIKYFISLRQYALSKESYEYLQNLKKITEQTGSIFDAQPSQVSGNIHCLNHPDETVLGFLTASTEETKERYISNAEVQPWDYKMDNCEVVEIKPDRIATAFSENSLVPLSLDGGPYNLLGVYATTHDCADCRVLGGVTDKPGFWP